MTEQVVRLPSGIEICYESYGNESDPALVLVMGLGCPMGWWTPAFCERLAVEGFRVTRFDNRDTGRSTHVRGTDVTRTTLARAFFGLRTQAPYTLSDMAADVVGLLDGLGAGRGHIVGASLGGAIAQTVAVEHPDRVLSLTSMMSTTGRRTVGWQSPRLVSTLLHATGPDRDGYIAHSTRLAERVASPGYPLDREMVRQRAAMTYDCGWSASGVLRQMLAFLTQPDRTGALGDVTVPTCVVHGLSDPMIHPSGGRATARAVPGSELIMFPGMGHDMPEPLCEPIITAIARTAHRAALLR